MAVAALLVGVAVTLEAVGGNTERVTSLWTGAETSQDGSAHITEVIDYDFGSGERRGIFREVPGLSPDAEVTVTSASAPVPYELIDLGSQTRIRIGDPSHGQRPPPLPDPVLAQELTSAG
ncbi:DUF2207 domain-containing protein [Streptomyces sporangiiformans]|uniref:DUF2207 domain-containing protein n=1 Tax=Streptomyces sporangiiformans TaxID=2315329 RepID=A0A505DMW6_9ACTN|nr:DUF2207 domain-containing protein [Streptomyces sporangiiformans]TPQ22686.1 DUF2207 domain-containing protein [Streptomyces sporangiiformans]